MLLKLVARAKRFNCCITPGFGQGNLHRFVEQLETLDFIDRCYRGLRIVKDHEGLSFGAQIGFGNNVKNSSIT